MGPAQAAARPFIRRSGDHLMEGTELFRFVSFNAPAVLLNDKVWPRHDDNEATLDDRAWEQEDLMKSLEQAGTRVARLFVISTQGEFPPSKPGERRHVSFDAAGNAQFDEQLFYDMDRALELANVHGIRLIIPLVAGAGSEDSVAIWGGAFGYARARGKPDNDFYTDPQLKADFKTVINYVLNRTNRRTCVKYKDDPAVLAWETGNEIFDDHQAWTEEIAGTIKSIDPNHLVMDGHYKISDDSLSPSSLVDVVSQHFYGGDLNEVQLLSAATRANGHKPFIAGEFGLNDGGDAGRIGRFLDAVVHSTTSGALIWALRSHSRFGGFFSHCDNPSTDGSCALHWPGFPPARLPHYQEPEEQQVMGLVLDASARARTIPLGGDGRRAPPERPRKVSAIASGRLDYTRWRPIFVLSWQGSAGADTYVVERATDEGGPYVEVTSAATDNRPWNYTSTATPLVNDDDPSLRVGQVYHYRVRAVFTRSDGSRALSAPSDPVTTGPTSCGGPWSDTDDTACRAGGLDVPFSTEPATCGRTVVDPCGVSHRCSPCPRCRGARPCYDGSCPQDHGGVCPRTCPPGASRCAG